MYTEQMYNDSLCHFGTLGMKWGIRKYQNKDGSLTPEGKARYGSGKVKEKRKVKKLTDAERKKRNNDRLKSALAITGGLLTGVAIVHGTKFLKNKKLSTQLISEALNNERYHEAKDLVDMYKNYPLSFDKMYERKELKSAVSRNLHGIYINNKYKYRSNPTQENKENLQKAADRYAHVGKYMAGKRNRHLKQLKKETSRELIAARKSRQ